MIDPKALVVPEDIMDVEIRLSSPDSIRSITLDMKTGNAPNMIIDEESGLWRVQIDAKVGWAGMSRHYDGRITRQMEVSDRLLAHLKLDCPELRGAGRCPHMEG